MSDHLSICVFLHEEPLVQAVLKCLSAERRYTVALPRSADEFFALIDQEKQQLDCLVLQDNAELSLVTKWLYGQAVLLPAVIIQTESDQDQPSPPPLPDRQGEGFAYHTAEAYLKPKQIEQLPEQIDRAIAQFINLSPFYRLSRSSAADQATDLNAQNFLKLQQQRLTEKLKERLGYLGVYYKRNPKHFFRHLSAEQKQQLLDQLKREYREIVLRYFSNDGTLNQRIDDFVNTIFFTDIPVAQVVEIHMDLMDEFAKQLKLEGRSEEILLDYRLTLIDTIAHLCEMYRRSIPRES